jgi:hypothetical protein
MPVNKKGVEQNSTPFLYLIKSDIEDPISEFKITLLLLKKVLVP